MNVTFSGDIFIELGVLGERTVLGELKMISERNTQEQPHIMYNHTLCTQFPVHIEHSDCVACAKLK